MELQFKPFTKKGNEDSKLYPPEEFDYTGVKYSFRLDHDFIQEGATIPKVSIRIMKNKNLK